MLTSSLLSLPVLLSAGCVAAVAALLVADRLDQPAGRVVAKLSASTLFLLVAVALGATGSTYGQLVLAALVLGWLGDACLLSRRSGAFMAGLGAFLLSHLAYAAAFMLDRVAPGAMALAAAAALATGALVLRWLRPHLPPELKRQVVVYVVVILAMCVAAAGHAQAFGRWAVLGGAVLFALSDIAVARDRFVNPSYTNRLWGWPAYFAAQLLLAWSVPGPR